MKKQNIPEPSLIEKLIDKNNILKMMSAITQDIFFIKDKDKLFKKVCEEICKYGYKMVWIGICDEKTKKVIPVAQNGFEKGYLENINITYDDSEYSKGPTGTAIKTKRPSVMEFIETDPRYAPWREAALKRGYKSSASIPLLSNNKVIGALNIYSEKENAFNQEGVDLLLELSRDISMALDNIEKEDKLKKADKVLRENEEKFRTIFKNEPECVKLLDREGCLLEMNPAGLTMIDATLDQVKGQKVINLVAKEDRSSFNEMIEAVFRGETRPLVFDMIGLKGRRLTLETISAPIKDSIGKTISLLGVSRDITDRKRSEEKLRDSEKRYHDLFNNSEIPLFRSRIDGSELLDVNKKLKLIFGKENLRGKPSLDFWVDKRQRKEFIKILKEKGKISGFECKLWNNKKEILYGLMSAVICKEEGILEGSIIDITEIKNLENELKKEKDLLEKKVLDRTAELEKSKIIAELANKSKTYFLANMSHEMRTPLTAIIGFTQIIHDGQMGEINKEQKEGLKDVLDSSKHLLSLINDILDVSRIEAGKIELHYSNFYPKEILKNAETILKEKTVEKNIEFTISFESKIETISINADEEKTKQTLYNLLSNAIKFTPDGGKIEMGLKEIKGNSSIVPEKIKKDLLKSDSFILFYVKDTGIGIKKEDQDTIFQEFTQIEPPATKKFSGAGLGLALSKKLTEAQNGRMWFFSEGENKGSTFCFILPIKN